jgi:iron complex outermembrane recepter protein
MIWVFKKALLVAGCAAALLPAQRTLGQSAAKNSITLEEVVVTAQRREENLQNVPIAVTAVSGDALEKAGIADTSGLKALVPSLSFSTAVGGLGLPRIRGVGSTGQGPGIENPVATYVDGVYMSSSIGALTSLSDVAQVAVLKGPQGTLFGRNATGGLIQITTRQPSHVFKADFQATAGNYGSVGGRAYLTGGFSNRVAASAAFNYDQRREGYGINVKTGHRILDQESYTGRAKLLWEPSDTTSVTLSGDTARVTSANPAFRSISRNVRGKFALGGQRDIHSDVDPALKTEQYGASLEIRHSFGGMDLMSLSAYRRMKMRVVFDPDGTTEDQWTGVPGANAPPLGFAHGLVIDNTELANQFSQEVQLLSTTEGPFKWVVGAYYMSAKGEYQPGRTFTAFQTAGSAAFFIPPGRYNDLVVQQSLDTLAGFAQGTYSFGNATNLTAGLRHTRDERDASGIRKAVEASGAPVAVQTAPQGVVERFKKTFPKTTWRLSVDHRYSPELMTYASYNRGFRSAAFVVSNFGLVTAPENKELKPEVVDAFEVGVKSDLKDKRVRLNAAGYYYDQENVQVMQIVSGIQNIYNAKGAKLYGLDADGTAKVNERLTLTAGFNYVHGRYSSFTNAIVAIPQAAGGNLLTVGDATGKKLQNVPEWTANLGVSYDVPISLGDLSFNANYYRNDGSAADPDNRLTQPAFGLLDLSVVWLSTSKNLSLSLWGKNLTDEFYFQQLGVSNFADNGVQAAPRTYGLTFGVHF